MRAETIEGLILDLQKALQNAEAEGKISKRAYLRLSTHGAALLEAREDAPWTFFLVVSGHGGVARYLHV